MAFLRSAFPLFYIILVNNVTLYQGADNFENLTKESMCYALQEPYCYSFTEEYADYSEDLQHEEMMTVIESPLQDTLKVDAKCYTEPRNIESLKKILSSTCAPDEEKQT